MNERATVATCCTRRTTEENAETLPIAGNNPHTNTDNTTNTILMYTLTDLYDIVLPFRKGREILSSTSSLWWGEGWLRQLSSSVFFRLRTFPPLSYFHSAPTVVVVVRHPSPITHHPSPTTSALLYLKYTRPHPAPLYIIVYSFQHAHFIQIQLPILSTCPLHTKSGCG